MKLTHFPPFLPSCFLAALGLLAMLPAAAQQTLTGQDAFTDYSKEHPGVRRKITVADLPQPYSTESANNGAAVVPRPDGVWPQALPGFKVEQFATGLEGPRLMRMAPNGDIFLAEMSAGKILVFRGMGADGKAGQTEVFAADLKGPFGINFYPSGPSPQMGLRRQYCIAGPFSLSERRPEGPRPGADPGRVARRRRPQDARHRVYPGWKTHAGLGRIAFQ